MSNNYDESINDQYKKLEYEISSLEGSVMKSQILQNNCLNMDWESIITDIYSNQEEKFLIKQNINEIKNLKVLNYEKQSILNQLQEALHINQIQQECIKNSFLKNSDFKQIMQNQQLQMKKVQMENLKLKQKINKYKLKKQSQNNLQDLVKQKDELIQNLNVQIYQYNQINIKNEEKIKNLQDQLDRKKSQETSKNNLSLISTSNKLFSNIKSPSNKKEIQALSTKLTQIFQQADSIKKENNNPNTKKRQGSNEKVQENTSQRRYSMIQKPEENVKIHNFDDHIKLCKSDFKKKSIDKIQEEIKIDYELQDSMQNLVLNQEQMFQSDFEKEEDQGLTGSPQISMTSKSLFKTLIK